MAYKPKILALTEGGTNASLTASNGGILYSTASAAAVLAATSTANQPLLSGASGAPGWSTATYPGSTTANQLLYSSAANTVAGLASANSAILATDASGVPSVTTASGNWLNTTRTCFRATVSGIINNVTGDNTAYTVIFDSENFDQGSNYNPATGVFTAPVTGKYCFNTSIFLTGLTAANSITITLVSTGGNTNLFYGLATFLDGGGNVILNGSSIISMTATDTCTIIAQCAGGTKIVDVQAASYFSGFLVC